MAEFSLRKEFADSNYNFSSKVAAECSDLSEAGVAALVHLSRFWMNHAEDYYYFAEGTRPNPQRMTDRFGCQSVGRGIEMIDFENRELRQIAIPVEKFDAMLAVIAQFKAYNDTYLAMAEFCIRGKGVVAAHQLIAVTNDIAEKCTDWKESLHDLIGAGDDYAAWQNEILMQDADEPLGAYAARIADTSFKQVMEQRESHISEISTRYAETVLIAQEVDGLLADLSSSYKALAGHAQRVTGKILKAGYVPPAPQ